MNVAERPAVRGGERGNRIVTASTYYIVCLCEEASISDKKIKVALNDFQCCYKKPKKILKKKTTKKPKNFGRVEMRYSGWAQERWKGRRLVREMERFTNHLTRKQTARKRNNNSLMNCRRSKVDVRRKRRFTPAFHRVRHHESERARQ